MPVYKYSIKNRDGKTIKGKLEAESEQKIIEYFQKEQNIILSIEKAKQAKTYSGGSVKINELVIFSRQLTTLIESGISVVESLSALQDQIENVYFKKVVGNILRDIKEGDSFSHALSKQKKVFPEIYINMTEAAEVSGNLPDILNRVSTYLEKSESMKRKVKTAMYYPVTIVFIAGGITTFLMIKVVPLFQDIFKALGGTLPLPTRILIAVSDFLRTNILMGIVGLIVVVLAFIQFRATKKGRYLCDKLMLKIPIIGDLLLKASIARFARTFATLLKSGVQVIKCLDIVGKTSGNKIIEEAIALSKEQIQQGQPISLPLERSKVFPSMVIKMIGVGERSGQLEGMLNKIAEFYEDQTDTMVSGLSSLLEPLIIAFLGLVVGGIVVSLFLPILTITQYIG